jgi:hypothetical protein
MKPILNGAVWAKAVEHAQGERSGGQSLQDVAFFHGSVSKAGRRD